MAKVSISHRPDMTPEELLTIFERGFGDKYEVTPTPNMQVKLFNIKWDFFLKESGWRGVRVALNQESEDTKIVFAGSAPSPLANAAIMLTLAPPILFLYNGMMNEVRSFIAKEFPVTSQGNG
jgi:hypothetical protein